jgi:hypothetical protein
VGFGSLRTVRAESPVDAPRIHADLRLVNGVLQGTIRNESKQILESPAVVLGGNVVVLPDLAPGAEGTVKLTVTTNQFGQALSDKIFGQVFFGENVASSEKQRRDATRHRIVDQLTYDPMSGNTGQLPSDGPVILAWGRDSLLDIDVQGQKPTRSANILYYVPVGMSVSGTVAFPPDLIRSTVLATDAAFFTKDPYNMSFGQGSVTIAYRPIPFEGSFEATRVRLGVGFGEPIGGGNGEPIAPMPEATPGPTPLVPFEPPVACIGGKCPPDVGFGEAFLPELEVLDRTTGTWRRLPQLKQVVAYSLRDPATYVDPSTGTIQIRFVNERSEQTGVSFSLSLEGIVR